MKTQFTAEFFVANRAKLRAICDKNGPIVVTANGLLQKNSDSAYAFRQDSNFWYLTGIDEPDIILVIDDNAEYLIVPEQTDYQLAFDGVVNKDELSSISGVAMILGAKVGMERLGKSLKTSKTVASLAVPPEYIETYGMYTNPARRLLINRLQAINPTLKVVDIKPYLADMRAVKQPQELAAMQSAIDITASAIKYATADLSKLKYEYQVEAKIIEHFLTHGAREAWKPIVASGANGTVLHYIANRSLLSAADLIYIDVGAEVSHYTADITRSFCIGGTMTKRQQDVVTAVKEVQDYALKLIKPGVILRQYEKQVRQFMGQKLCELGLIKNITSKSVRQYYPHATSHFLGLDAHDVGDYDKPLAANMVITVEPGIYIPAENIGVRIEDDVLITASAYKNLSTMHDV